MLILLLICVCLANGLGVAFLYFYWAQIKRTNIPLLPEATRFNLTVVIVVRNEEGNIGELLLDIARQTYDLKLLEVLVVDDHSDDRTYDVVRKLIPVLPFKLRLLTQVHTTGKKAGLKTGVGEARGEVIVVTDGDCRLSQGWLESIENNFSSGEAVFVSGPVTYIGEKSLFEKMQTIEFASLVGAGAALIQAGKPAICNAANMAFLKRVFLEASDLRNDHDIPSGDDEFLLHAISRLYPDRIRYIKSKEAVVFTKGHSNWQDFFQQRKRWAGKWRLHREPSVVATAIGLFFLQLCWILLFPAMWHTQQLSGFFVGLLLKFCLEFLFLRSVLRSFGKDIPLVPFVFLQLIYPFYVLFFGIAVNLGPFTWKGRVYDYSEL